MAGWLEQARTGEGLDTLRRLPARDHAWTGAPPGDLGSDGQQAINALLASALLLAVAIALSCSLGGVWLWTAATSSVEVVVAKAAVPRGAVIAAGDLMVARVSLDPAIASIPASDVSTVVGQRAALDISAGGLLTPDAIAPETVPAKGETVLTYRARVKG